LRLRFLEYAPFDYTLRTLQESIAWERSAIGAPFCALFLGAVPDDAPFPFPATGTFELVFRPNVERAPSAINTTCA